jgi:hypothetical protein
MSTPNVELGLELDFITKSRDKNGQITKIRLRWTIFRKRGVALTLQNLASAHVKIVENLKLWRFVSAAYLFETVECPGDT